MELNIGIKEEQEEFLKQTMNEYSKDGIEKINATIEEIKITKGTLNQPNQKPTTAINLASPSPIPSFFLRVL